jgi:hypothetical protein
VRIKSLSSFVHLKYHLQTRLAYHYKKKQALMAQQLHVFLRNLFPVEHRWKVALFTRWKEIVGDLHSRVILEKITDDTLIFRVCHASWAQELHLLSPTITAKANAILNNKRIKHIRFRLEAVQHERKTKPVEKNLDHLCQQTILPHCMSLQEQQHLKSIRNKELRDELASFYLRCKRQNNRS